MQKLKTKITSKRWEIINLQRRIQKQSNNSIELAAHTLTLKQKKQINGRNHHIPLNIHINFNGQNTPIKRH
jgi:hypothetical protein